MAKDAFGKYVYSEYIILLSLLTVGCPKQKYPYFKFNLIHCEEKFHSLFHFRGSLTIRIVWSILVEVIVFIFTVILAVVDSSEWPGMFFGITLCTVVILNSK